MTIQSLSQIKSKGLVVYDGKDFKYVLQDELPNHEITPDSTLKELVKLNVAVAVLQKQPERVFVDYDQLTFGEKEPLSKGKAGDSAAKGREIVVHDSGRYFAINESVWKILPDEADAQVLVRRGAVVAVIPHSGILLGTYCVLVNLASLGKGA